MMYDALMYGVFCGVFYENDVFSSVLLRPLQLACRHAQHVSEQCKASSGHNNFSLPREFLGDTFDLSIQSPTCTILLYSRLFLSYTAADF